MNQINFYLENDVDVTKLCSLQAMISDGAPLTNPNPHTHQTHIPAQVSQTLCFPLKKQETSMGFIYVQAWSW